MKSLKLMWLAQCLLKGLEVGLALYRGQTVNINPYEFESDVDWQTKSIV